MKIRKLLGTTPVRVAVGVLLVIAAVTGALLLRAGVNVPCIFRLLTGLYCPGCGTGRALKALLYGEVAAAFSYNPITVLLLPFIAYYVLAYFLRYLAGRRLVPIPQIPMWVATTLAVVFVLFSVFRNLPFEPFCRLAPGALYG